MPISNTDTAVVSIDNDGLNAYLLQIKEQAVLQVLSKVFDNNERANALVNYDNTISDISTIDYDGAIIGRISLFDDAIGYQVAYNTLGMMLTTSRVNNRERSVSDKGQIRLEQQGIRDAEGKLLVPGVTQYLQKAIDNIINVLFPAVKNDKNPRIRNASMYW